MKKLPLLCLVFTLTFVAQTLSAQHNPWVGQNIDGGPTAANIASVQSRNGGRHIDIIEHWADWNNDPFSTLLPYLSAIYANGSIMELAFQPKDKGSFITNAQINSGQYDVFLHQYARDVAAWGKLIWFRLMHEMNADWMGWSPGLKGNTGASFINAWHRIVDIFRAEGANNVKWVYSVNLGSKGNNTFTSMYPGNNYVDYNSIDLYNWGTSHPDWPSKWQRFSQCIDEAYNALAPLGKPINISEWGCVEVGGSKANWIINGFNQIRNSGKYNLIQAAIWFDTNYTAPGNQDDYRMNSSSASLQAYITATNFTSPPLPGKSNDGQVWKHGRLKILSNGHYLQYEDGTPFFWLGDTGWDLFYKLKLNEIKEYLDNRAAKGFNVIQAVALAEPDGVREPNAYGELPLHDIDPTRPNNEYFLLIDSTLKMAAQRQIFIGLLPTWGDKVNKMWGKGPVIFDTAKAYTYGKWIGNRYKNEPNIIWIIGGDRPAFNDTMDWRPVWRAMVRGIREETDGKALITYHPSGESSSSQFWTGENTLDLNMIQSGHRKPDLPTWEWISHDYDVQPPKPVLDGEINYEDHPINWNPQNGYFRDYDVRKQLYRSVFSGACGVTYGHNSIFQFYGNGDEKINFADRYWKQALDRPGAFQAGYLKKLILARPSLNRVPDNSLILSGQGKEPSTHMCAFRDRDGSYAMIYLPVGKKIQINTSLLKAKRIKAWWFNPKTGKVQESHSFKAAKSQWFTPPIVGKENDWVLILDDMEKGYKTPGVNN